MKKLTQARLRELLHYDPETGVFTRLVARKGPKAWVGCVAGSPDRKGYTSIVIDQERHAAHRLAWFYVHGSWPDGQIDHINGVKDDNRLANLRVVSNQVNGQNSRVARSSNRVGLLGVTPWKKRFRASIYINGRSVYLGLFAEPEQAHAAYVEAKRQIHPGCTI